MFFSKNIVILLLRISISLILVFLIYSVLFIKHIVLLLRIFVLLLILVKWFEDIWIIIFILRFFVIWFGRQLFFVSKTNEFIISTLLNLEFLFVIKLLAKSFFKFLLILHLMSQFSLLLKYLIIILIQTIPSIHVLMRKSLLNVHLIV